MAYFKFEDVYTYDNAKKIKSIRFPISRYGIHEKIIEFNDLISINDAIKQAEKFLSQLYNKQYFDKMKDELFIKSYDNFEDILHQYPIRGSLLGCCIFLEHISINKQNQLCIQTGS